MTYIYLAHPIDRAPASGVRWGQLCTKALLEAGATAVYDPATAWSVNDPAGFSAKLLQDTNVEALRRADGCLAVLPDDVTSVGTPMEILLAARDFGIPTVVLGGVGSVALRWLRVPTMDPDPEMVPQAAAALVQMVADPTWVVPE